jgi:hypothetical protein
VIGGGMGEVRHIFTFPSHFLSNQLDAVWLAE